MLDLDASALVENYIQEPHTETVRALFADDLRTQYAADVPQRGSAEAILQALDQAGPLQFAPGELDALLAEVQALRDKGFAQQPLPKTLLDLRGSVPASEAQDFAAIRDEVIRGHAQNVAEHED